MRAVFMGTPAYVIPVMEALLSLGHRLVGVYTQPDKPAGRGRVNEPPPVKSYALGQGIEVLQPPSLRKAEAHQELRALGPDVLIVAAYGKILPPEVLGIPCFGCVNVHPSLLPRYRGPSPVASALLEGETHTGTTIMLMDQGMDTGPILAARCSGIQAGEATTASLTEHLFQLGGELLKEVLPLWLRAEISPRPQDESRATVTRKLEKVDGEARWELSAEELGLRLRAFTPWPGLYTHWKGKILKILSAVAFPSPQGCDFKPSGHREGEGYEPGTVVTLNQAEIALGVVAGQGILGIKSLQMEGRRPSNSEEFVRGYVDFPGSKLPS